MSSPTDPLPTEAGRELMEALVTERSFTHVPDLSELARVTDIAEADLLITGPGAEPVAPEQLRKRGLIITEVGR